MRFSCFDSARSTTSPGDFSLSEVWEVITLKRKLSDCPGITPWKWCDNWPFHVKEYRETGHAVIKEQKMIALMFFGVGQRRELKQVSGLFVVDIDYQDNTMMFDLMDIEDVKKLIFDKLPDAALIFISPNGKGLKVVHRINPTGHADTPERIGRHAYFQLQKAYQEIGLSIDDKCKDWNRLCFLSFDRKAILREDAPPRELKMRAVAVKEKSEYQEIPKELPSWVLGFLSDGCSKGSRNDTAFKVSCEFARRGIDERQIFDRLSSVPGLFDGGNKESIRKTVGSACRYVKSKQ